jgi:hypothetical protein
LFGAACWVAAVRLGASRSEKMDDLGRLFVILIPIFVAYVVLILFFLPTGGY